MKLLALETSTETLSIALGLARADGTVAIAATHEGAGGAQSSATLLPAILRLLGQAGWSLPDLSAIVFGEGPGSFTGLRTACSVAQGLALGAGLPVLPVDTLMAVAEEASGRAAPAAADGQPAVRILAALDARMGEVYFGLYERAQDGAPGPRIWQHRGAQLAAPEDIQAAGATLLAGNARAVHGERLPPALAALPHLHCLPTAGALLRLAPALLAQGRAVDPALAVPRYVRDKVAKTTEERAAERLAAGQAAQPVQAAARAPAKSAPQ